MIRLENQTRIPLSLQGSRFSLAIAISGCHFTNRASRDGGPRTVIASGHINLMSESSGLSRRETGHEQSQTRACADPGLGPRGLHRRHLCRARHAEARADPGRPARRPAHHHHRRRELSGLRRCHPGPLAHGADAGPGRARRHRNHHGPHLEGGPEGAPDPPRRRFRRSLHLRHADHLHRRPGALARHRLGADLQGLRRLRLRHLRRLLLQEQGSGRRRRRQHRGRGSDLPDQFRQARHRRSPPRSFPRREDPAGAPVQEPQDRSDLG